MQKIDHLDIDGRLLQTFVAVFDDQSISQAAARLHTNQSTVSHRLDRLRKIVGDPLFVRAGRGIVATDRASAMIEEARLLVDRMAELVVPDAFDVAALTHRFTIAATDYERDLLLIDSVKMMMREAPGVSFDLLWDDYDRGKSLRRGVYDLVLTPDTMDGGDSLNATPLFVDHFLCFFDGLQRPPPRRMTDYRAARHVRVLFSESDHSFVDDALADVGESRHIAADLPSLNELPRLLSGTDLIATLPARLGSTLMRGMDFCPVPFALPNLVVRMHWHRRTHASAAHQWLRRQIAERAELLPPPPGRADEAVGSSRPRG